MDRYKGLPALVQDLLCAYWTGSGDSVVHSPDRAAQVIDWFRCDAEAVSSLSHWHTNGFMKFVRVVPQDPRLQIRLHHWPADAKRGWSSVHNHRATFISLVLSGRLEERRYGLGPGPAGAAHELFCYRPLDWTHGGGGAERVIKTRWLQELHISAEETVDAGHLRTVHAGSFHQVNASSTCTTLVIRGVATMPMSEIAVPEGSYPALASSLEALTAQQAQEALDRMSQGSSLPAFNLPSGSDSRAHTDEQRKDYVLRPP